MPRVKRQKPPKLFVVVDTNILWHSEKTEIVSPDFTVFWTRYKTEFELELVVPEVVRGELLYQRTRSATRALRKANLEFNSMRILADQSYRHRVTDERLENDIASRLDSWLTAESVRVIDVPTGSLDWDRLIGDAIWHRPPFDPEPKEQKYEKGFKDALILHTLIDFCGLKRSGSKTAFVCSDGLLRAAAQSEFEDNEDVYVFEGLDELESYLRLTKEALTENFVREIQSKASGKFFDTRDDSTLIFRENVVDRIRKQFADEFLPPKEKGTLATTLTLLGSGPSRYEWEAANQESIYVARASFDRLQGENSFHWNTIISFVQLFEKGDPLSTLDSGYKRFLRKLRFSVAWSATVRSHGGFYELEVDGISLDSSKFDVPSPEERRRYSLSPDDENNDAA